MTWLPKQTVVVPVDFSEASAQAVTTALELVENPANVHVVYVLLPLENTAPAVLWGTIDNESREKAVRNHFDKFLKEHDFPDVTFEVKTGDPGFEITNYAKAAHADLIVIPSHGYHGVKRLLLGSVAERVLRHAECPVLVLRRRDAD